MRVNESSVSGMTIHHRVRSHRPVFVRAKLGGQKDNTRLSWSYRRVSDAYYTTRFSGQRLFSEDDCHACSDVLLGTSTREHVELRLWISALRSGTTETLFSRWKTNRILFFLTFANGGFFLLQLQMRFLFWTRRRPSAFRHPKRRPSWTSKSIYFPRRLSVYSLTCPTVFVSEITLFTGIYETKRRGRL